MMDGLLLLGLYLTESLVCVVEHCRQLKRAVGLDNLLYTPDADFSCFADLALASPADYYIEGQGSLLQ